MSLFSNIFKNINFPYLKNEVSKIGKELLVNQNNNDWKKIIHLEKFQTYADLFIHEQLCKCINKLNLSIPIYSEETISENSNSDEYWLLDPIDGTSSWYHGFNGYVIQISLISKKKVIFGLIHWPFKKLTWICGPNGSLMQNDYSIERIKPSKVVRFIDNYPKPSSFLSPFIKLFKNSSYIECGSIGLKAMMVATGHADLFIKNTRFQDWDIAPLLPLSNQSRKIYFYDLNMNIIKLNNLKPHIDGLMVSRDLKLIKKVYDSLKFSNVN